MFGFLLALLLLDSIILAAAVLLQAGKGGGLAASFGGAGSSPNSLLGSREAGNLLTKTSWTCGGIFIGLAFILQLMSTNARAPRSVLDDVRAPSAPASAPATTTPPANSPLQPITAPPTGTAGKQATPPGKQPPAGKQQ